MPDDGIDVLGLLSQERLTEELLSAKALVAPSVGMESFGMVLDARVRLRAAVVASDIPGYREVMTPGDRCARPAGRPGALADAVATMLEDEPRRRRLGAAGRRLAVERYSWDDRRAARRDLRARRRRASRCRATHALEPVPA